MRLARMAACVTAICLATGLAPAADSAPTTGPGKVASSVKTLCTFDEEKCPFTVGDASAKPALVEEHATQGKALRLDRSYVVMDVNQDWSAFDFLKVDTFTEAAGGVFLRLELRDAAGGDYWTRLNYTTLIPPGKSTLIVPIKGVRVGEKSRPGRPLDLKNITKLAFVFDKEPPVPVFLDNVRLESDPALANSMFEGLRAFDFQPQATDPVAEGFAMVLPKSEYSSTTGFGLVKGTQVVLAENLLGPEPLYQDYIAIGKGTFAVDVPNGKYRVWVNVNRPAGFWGNMQRFSHRAITAQGKSVVEESMDEAAFKKRFFDHFADDDMPADKTFDKYECQYDEKTFDAEVTDGQLKIGFEGNSDACAVSALVLFPADKAAQGAEFLKQVRERRRFMFDIAYKRILHVPAGDALAPTAEDQKRGYLTFVRDVMKGVFYNDRPLKAELGKTPSADAFAGEMAPLTLAVLPLQDLGKVTVSISDLAGPGTIAAGNVEVGNVSYRMRRVTGDGGIFTIAPQWIMPQASIDMPRDVVRRFWLTVHVPADAKAGTYSGKMTIKPEKGSASEVPVELRVRAGTLDEVDVPTGPWGCGAPFVDDETNFKKMREYGFTSFSSGRVLQLTGFKDGKPVFSPQSLEKADKLMEKSRQMGFKAVVFYDTLISGVNAYYIDKAKCKQYGFGDDYAAFLKALYDPVVEHAKEKNWLPYYVNLGDEPIGKDLTASAENAEQYRKAYPKGPPFFCGATSVYDTKDDHFRLAKALHVATLGNHPPEAVEAIQKAGGSWAFYNGGNRWTFGDYMYKAAREHQMQFRLSWIWNLTMGDPYFALDSREDELSWFNVSPDGRLVPSLHVEFLREGLGDCRRLITLEKLAAAKADTEAGKAGQKLIADRMASFKLGQRDHDLLFGAEDWAAFRAKINDAIEAMRK